MAEASSLPRLAQLRDVVEKDPKSRLFVQLADEHRRAGQPGEAITVLRRGLEQHPTYVGAWTALGKLYVESGRDADAITCFERVLSIDPQNVVSARHLGDIHLRRNQPVEAVKRYKLVRAITPGDRELEERIAALEESIGQGPAVVSLPLDVPTTKIALESPAKPDLPVEDEPTVQPEPLPIVESEASPFDETGGEAVKSEGRDLDARELWQEEAPVSMDVTREESVPLAGEPAVGTAVEEAPEPRVQESSAAVVSSDDDTLTLAELYLRQGHTARAREILRRLSESDPTNEELRRRLTEIETMIEPPRVGNEVLVRRLEEWLQRVRRSSGRPALGIR